MVHRFKIVKMESSGISALPVKLAACSRKRERVCVCVCVNIPPAPGNTSVDSDSKRATCSSTSCMCVCHWTDSAIPRSELSWFWRLSHIGRNGRQERKHVPCHMRGEKRRNSILIVHEQYKRAKTGCGNTFFYIQTTIKTILRAHDIIHTLYWTDSWWYWSYILPTQCKDNVQISFDVLARLVVCTDSQQTAGTNYAVPLKQLKASSTCSEECTFPFSVQCFSAEYDSCGEKKLKLICINFSGLGSIF